MFGITNLASGFCPVGGGNCRKYLSSLEVEPHTHFVSGARGMIGINMLQFKDWSDDQ